MEVGPQCTFMALDLKGGSDLNRTDTISSSIVLIWNCIFKGNVAKRGQYENVVFQVSQEKDGSQLQSDDMGV